MIFGIHYLLLYAGWSACSALLGSYMIRYGGASELDLGLVFTIMPFTVFARPLISAQADRLSAHKRLLTWSLFMNATAYIPFIMIPFLLKQPAYKVYLTPRTCYWILFSSHIVGSLSYCGIRSLGDTSAVNYAKRVGTNFGRYRLFGALSFGFFGYLLGLINQNWLLPDFVPTMMTYVGCIYLLMILVYLWPDECFKMAVQQEKLTQEANQVPSSREVLAHMRSRLWNLVTCSSSSASSGEFDDKRNEIAPIATIQRLSAKQQLSIFLLLLRRDIRIPLFLLLLVFSGMSGYAPGNFVYTRLNQVCQQQGSNCDGAILSGSIMLGVAIIETICYLLIGTFKSRINTTLLIEATLITIILRYYFYGFILDQLSPQFFLFEALHGWEYAASLTVCVELGYEFANEVEYLIPELIERDIINRGDNHELVKVSLMATMNSCFTLVYDGIGTILGAFLYGWVTDRYSFNTTWILVGSLASSVFIAVLIAYISGKCFNVRPQIFDIKEKHKSMVV